MEVAAAATALAKQEAATATEALRASHAAEAETRDKDLGRVKAALKDVSGYLRQTR